MERISELIKKLDWNLDTETQKIGLLKEMIIS